jgi:hypothetical protein
LSCFNFFSCSNLFILYVNLLDTLYTFYNSLFYMNRNTLFAFTYVIKFVFAMGVLLKVVLASFFVFAFSSHVFSQSAFDHFTASPTFLESILSNHSTPSVQVLTQLKEWAKLPNRYLSLGESHLEYETAIPINFMLAETYRASLLKPYVFCAEKIPTFLESAQGRDLQSFSIENLIFLNNSSSRTDFTDCNWKSKFNAIVYSGFFHQYPFAKYWPHDFPIYPVISEPDNNIAAQLSKKQGLFISQIEVPYIESLAARNILSDKSLNADSFRMRVSRLNTSLNSLNNKMELLFGDSENDFANKYGVFLGPQAFSQNINMPNPAWILLTTRGYKFKTKRLHLLNTLARLSDFQLNTFLEKLRAGKFHYFSLMFGPDQSGEKNNTFFYGVEMHGESEAVVLNDLLYVLEPSEDFFKCYNTTGSSDGSEPPQPVNCEIN